MFTRPNRPAQVRKISPPHFSRANPWATPVDTRIYHSTPFGSPIDPAWERFCVFPASWNRATLPPTFNSRVERGYLGIATNRTEPPSTSISPLLMPDDVDESVLVGDLLEDARRRLGLACWVFAVGLAVAYPAVRIYGIYSTGGWSRLVPDLSAAVTTCVAVVLALLVKRRALPTKAVLTAATWLGPVLILGLSITEASAFALGTQLVHGSTPFEGISWTCTIILLFPILIPASLRQTAVASYSSALMFPLALYFFTLFTNTPGMAPFSLAIGAAIPTVICATAAVISSQVLRGLRDKLHSARKVGLYELTEKLGEGGMGEVWRAKHHRLARPVAVKVVKKTSPVLGGKRSARTLLRFEREAQATAQLTCPHTVTVFDFGIAEDGTFFYVMELLDGMDLRTLIKNHGPQPAERVVHWLIQCCSSLEEAHSVGLVHRDIKPANIVCCRYGLELDFIKVLDFGLVAEVERTASDDTQTFAGTPGFAAPEAVLADRPVGPSQDIYSLGCVAYILLAGTGVFCAKSSIKVAMMHVSKTPEAPSVKLGTPIHSDLESIVMDCLEKTPERRPASVAEMRQRLEALNLQWEQSDAVDWWQNVAGDVTFDEEGDTLFEQTRKEWL